MFAASAGAVKSLQKYSFWRQTINSPELLVRQAQEERIRNKSSGMVNKRRGRLRRSVKAQSCNKRDMGPSFGLAALELVTTQAGFD